MQRSEKECLNVFTTNFPSFDNFFFHKMEILQKDVLLLLWQNLLNEYFVSLKNEKSCDFYYYLKFKLLYLKLLNITIIIIIITDCILKLKL